MKKEELKLKQREHRNKNIIFNRPKLFLNIDISPFICLSTPFPTFPLIAFHVKLPFPLTPPHPQILIDLFLSPPFRHVYTPSLPSVLIVNHGKKKISVS